MRKTYKITQNNPASHMKCNSCGKLFKAFAIQEGQTCRAPLDTKDPNVPIGNRCTGSLFEVEENENKFTN